MKNLPLLPLLLLSLTLCTCDRAPSDTREMDAPSVTEPAAELPTALHSVLAAHGGLEAWQKQGTLTYDIVNGDKRESQTVDLKDRRELILREGVKIGYDGEKSWTVSEEPFEGDPVFYRNLMFYFYAMPWVLADPGIRYEDTTPLSHGGRDYPGLKISYDDGIGLSPKDNYFLHWDPNTKRMRWLGYTVTGRSGEVSDKISWIEYPTWTEYSGVALADSLVWYNKENNLPTERRNARVFEKVEVFEEGFPEEFYAAPDSARVWE